MIKVRMMESKTENTADINDSEPVNYNGDSSEDTDVYDDTLRTLVVSNNKLQYQVWVLNKAQEVLEDKIKNLEQKQEELSKYLYETIIPYIDTNFHQIDLNMNQIVTDMARKTEF